MIKRKGILFFCVLAAFSVSLPACGGDSGGSAADDRTSALWDNTVRIYLQDDLWSERDNYDAGHVLMVPLHAAFRMEVPAWRRQFSDHFARFMGSDNTSFLSQPDVQDLAREHYLYLASRFVFLAADSGQASLIPDGLVGKLYEEVVALWRVKPAWWFGPASFPGGIRERLSWKLSRDATTPSYYRAITDHENFLFAIAADLRAYELTTGTRHLLSPDISDILDMAFLAYGKHVVPLGGGTWLFQPGVWRDHPDFLYAGNENLAEGLLPSPVDDVAEDASHSHRWPVWLGSLRAASRHDAARRQYYDSLMDGLAARFFQVVLRNPESSFPAYRVTNYMDGRNGVYQYDAVSGGGYAPYQLSGILAVGWWGMLPDQRARDMCADMSGRFPLAGEVVSTYTGPNTTRDRNPMVKWPDFFTNGFAELLMRLARRELL